MKKLILVVDDDYYIVEFLKEVLESFNIDIEIIISYNGLDGIKKIENHINKLFLIFLDVRMPKVDGLQVYTKTRLLSKTIPIILMSGAPLAEISEDENLYFLPKPFSYYDVERIIEKLNL